MPALERRQYANLSEMIGVSKHARQMREFCDKVAHSNIPVLLLGETGVGKDFFAKHIHYRGRGCNDFHFVPVDCGLLNEGLSDSELFGHTAGAFTDGREEKKGLLWRARKGTLFLNEIGNMTLELQRKFLRLMDDETFRQIGSVVEVPMETRIIAATNEDLKQLVRLGKLRKDLYFRFNSIVFHLAPLRDRREDIPALADHFLSKEVMLKRFTSDAYELMQEYHWPGNIRELSKLVLRTYVHSGQDEILTAEHVRPHFDEEDVVAMEVSPSDSQVDSVSKVGLDDMSRLSFLWRGGEFPKLESIRARVYKAVIFHALTICRGNQSSAAQLLGITRGSLRHMCRLYDIKVKNEVFSPTKVIDLAITKSG